MKFNITIAESKHVVHAVDICQMMEEASKKRGTGIAKRTPEYIIQKINEGKAVIAFFGTQLVGFCYIESWEDHKYIANSGLIVHEDFRKTGVARQIKQMVFDLSRKKFPNGKIFGITTSAAVMKINSDLGYRPVTFPELTKDEDFWAGCKSCLNYDILQRTNKTMCLCTGMVYDIETQPQTNDKGRWEKFSSFMLERRKRIEVQSKKIPKLLRALKNEK